MLFNILSYLLDKYSDLHKIMFHSLNIRYNSVYTTGIPLINISRGRNMSIGHNFRMNNTPMVI